MCCLRPLAQAPAAAGVDRAEPAEGVRRCCCCVLLASGREETVAEAAIAGITRN